MRSVILLLLLFTSSAIYGQIDVFYTGRMLGYFRFPDKQNFYMNACPSSNDEMNPAAKGLFEVWQQRRGKHADALLVGMGDNFGPDFHARTFERVSKGEAIVPFPSKDRYVYARNKSSVLGWYPDSTKKLSPPNPLPADNVACFIRAMGYTALVPGKEDFYYGPTRLQELAKLLYSGGIGTAMLAVNLSIATGEPEAKPRLPLYQQQKKIEERQKLSPNEAHAKYSVLPPTSAKAAAPAVKFPDVVLPTFRKFFVDNAYFLSYDQRLDSHEVISDNTEGFALKMVSAGKDGKTLVMTNPNVIMDRTGTFYFADPNWKTMADLKGERRASLRIDSLQVCENPTDPDVKTPNCFDVPAAKTAAKSDYKTARVNFEMDHEFLRRDHNYAACLHLSAGVTKSATKYDVEYYCQPFYVARPFFTDTKSANEGMDPKVKLVRDPYAFTPPRKAPAKRPTPAETFKRGIDAPYVVKEFKGTSGKLVKVAVFGVVDPDMQATIGRLNYASLNKNNSYETSAQISSLTNALNQAMMRCELEETTCNAASTRKILLAQMPAAKATQLLNNIDKQVFDLIITESDANNRTVDGGAERQLEKDTPKKFVVVPGQLFSPIRNIRLPDPDGIGLAL